MPTTRDNLYNTDDGSLRDRNFKSMTGIAGFRTSTFQPDDLGPVHPVGSRFVFQIPGDLLPGQNPIASPITRRMFSSAIRLPIVSIRNSSSRDQLTAGVVTDLNRLKLTMIIHSGWSPGNDYPV